MDVLGDRANGKLPFLITNQPPANIRSALIVRNVDRFVVISSNTLDSIVRAGLGSSFPQPIYFNPSFVTKGAIAQAISIITGWGDTPKYVMEANPDVFGEMDVKEGPSQLTDEVKDKFRELNDYFTRAGLCEGNG